MPDEPSPRTPSLVVEVSPADGACIVRLAGELDADDAPRVRALLAEQVLGGSGSLVVDLSGLSFLDSAGLAALIAAHKGTRAAGTQLVLAGPSEAVRKVLSVTGLASVFETADTVEAALDQVRDAPEDRGRPGQVGLTSG